MADVAGNIMPTFPEPTTHSWRRGINLVVQRFRPRPLEFTGQPWERPTYWHRQVTRAQAVLTHPMTTEEFEKALRRAGCKYVKSLIASGDGVAWGWDRQTQRWIPINREDNP